MESTKLRVNCTISCKMMYSCFFAEKAQEVKAMAEQGLNAAKDKCKAG